MFTPLIDTTSRIGVGETRHIVGDYNLTDDDLYADRRLPDSITTIRGGAAVRGQGTYVDVHAPDPIRRLAVRSSRAAPRVDGPGVASLRCALPQAAHLQPASGG